MDREDIDFELMAYEENLQKAVSYLEGELVQIRAGRANPKILERIMVDYYGTMTPLHQMATISVPEARMIIVSMWDISMLRAAAKAIMEANLGVAPSDDGKIIRLCFPPLTLERRKEFVKEIGKLSENAKVTCRNERRDILEFFKKLKKDSTISEDEYAGYEKDVQKKLDATVAKIDEMYAKKEKDILEV